MNLTWMRRACVLALMCGAVQPSKAEVTAVLNSANYAGGGVSPGEIVVIYGTPLGPGTLVQGAIDPATNRFATTVAQTRVLFDGTPAPIIYVSRGQSSVVVPYSVAGKSAVTVSVEFQGTSSGTLQVPVVGAVPGLFSVNAQGTEAGVFFNQDGTQNTAKNPIRPGEVIVMYGTGEGQIDPPGVDGSAANAPYPKPSQSYEVTIGGRKADVAYFGSVPGFIVGLFQINAYIPADTPPGVHEVLVKVGNATSTPLRAITVYVGGKAPVLSSSSGRPGQKVSMTFPNPAEARSITLAVFRLPDAPLPAPAPIEVDAAAGKISFYVPYIQDNEQPQGYVTGNFTLSLKRGDAIVGSLPFRIDPLQPVTDPINKFKSIVTDLAAYTRSSLQQQQGLSTAISSTASGLQALIDRASSPLVKMADDIAAQGFADLPLDLYTPGSPTVRVSRRELENLVAMSENNPLLDGTGTVRSAAIPRAANQSCIGERLYQYCLSIASKTPEEIAKEIGMKYVYELFRRAVLPPIKPKSDCSVNPADMTASIVASTFLPVLREYSCKVYPTKPTQLTAYPAPDPIPIDNGNPILKSGNLGTRVNLRMTPYWTRDFAVDQVARTAYMWGLQQVLGQTVTQGCSAQFTSSLNTLAQSMFNQATGQLKAATGSFAIAVDETLDTCSVSSITTDPERALPGRTNYNASKNGSPSDQPDKRFRWGVEGINPGNTKIRIEAKPEEFPPYMFAIAGCEPPPPTYLTMFSDYDPITPCMPVTVAQPKKQVFVRSQILANTVDDSPRTVDVNREVTNVYADGPSGNDGTSTVEIKKGGSIADNLWTMTQTVKGSPVNDSKSRTTWNSMTLDINNWPGPREVRVHVHSDVSGSCQGLDFVLTGWSQNTPVVKEQHHEGNNGCSGDWDLSVMSGQSANGNSPSVSLHVGVFVLGANGGFGAGQGTVTTEIRLVDDTVINPTF